ncbi:hypothetical protein D3C84_703410 [compost metagenome]
MASALGDLKTCWNTVLRNTVAISRMVVNSAQRRAFWLSSPTPIRLTADTSTINRIGQYQSPEKIRSDSCKAGCFKRWASGRLRIRCATGRRMRITSQPKITEANRPVNTAMLLVMLPPSCRAICGLVRASLRAARKPIMNNGRGLKRRIIATARRLWPALNITITHSNTEVEKMPLLVA